MAKRNARVVRLNPYRSDYQRPPQSRRQWRWRRYIKPAAYTALALFVTYVIIISPVFQIRTVTIHGNKLVGEQDIRHDVQTALSSSPLSHNILLLNSSKLSQQLQNQNPQLAQVTITKQFPSAITVTVGEQAPAILWRTGTTGYIISQDGRAYSLANGKESQFIVVTDTSNLPVTLGQPVVPSSFVSFVQDINGQLPGLGVTPISYTVSETTSEVVVGTKAGYTIRFDTTRSSSDQLNSLKSTLALLKQQNKKPSEYIDLRIPGRVFYK